MKKYPFYSIAFLILIGWTPKVCSQNLKESFKAVASDQTAQDNLGASVEITENYAIAGAPNQDKDTVAWFSSFLKEDADGNPGVIITFD